MAARTILAMIEADEARSPVMLRDVRARLTGRREVVFPATSGCGEDHETHLWCIDKSLGEKLDAVIAQQDDPSSTACYVIEAYDVYEAPYKGTLEVVAVIRFDDEPRAQANFDDTWAMLEEASVTAVAA